MATTRVGISGWRYDPWRGSFYPDDLPQRNELKYASARLPIIEINGSFYSLQKPQSYASWYADTPENFIFSVKGPKFITHVRRLKDVESPVANFLASGIFNLKEKLGPILWQFPPFMKYDPERFETFFKLLPHDTEQAALCAAKHDDWMKDRAQIQPYAKRPMRHAVEIRNESFMDPSFAELLHKYNVAFVVAETARKWPTTLEITADFVYMRLHGDKELYNGGYSDEALDRWADRIREWQKKQLDIYCFFDNTDVKMRAPFDAQAMMRKLGLTWGEAGESPPEPTAVPGRAARKPAAAPGDAGESPPPEPPSARKRARKSTPRKTAASASRPQAATGSRRRSARSS